MKFYKQNKARAHRLLLVFLQILLINIPVIHSHEGSNSFFTENFYSFKKDDARPGIISSFPLLNDSFFRNGLAGEVHLHFAKEYRISSTSRSTQLKPQKTQCAGINVPDSQYAFYPQRSNQSLPSNKSPFIPDRQLILFSTDLPPPIA